MKGVYGIVGVSLNGLPGALKQLVWIFALIFSVILPAHSQQTDELQKQLHELRQQYEQTTLELQSRIAALEQQIETLQGQLPSAPTCDLLRDADTKIRTLEEQVKSFEFHGCLRSGCGLNSRS